MSVFDVTLYLSATITLFVIMDPTGTIPIFLGLVGRKSAAARNRAARQAVLVSFSVIAGFALSGEAILRYLGIGIPALLLIALDLLTGKENAKPQSVEDVNVALVPLGTPLLAGPGAIVAVIVYVRQANGNLSSYLALAAAILTVHLILFLALRFSGVLIRLLRESGISLLARIAGLLLAAIAVQLIANAVRGFAVGV